MGTVYNVGPHYLEFFDDYYLSVPNGIIEEDHAKKINELQASHFGNKQYAILCDLTKLQSISAAARREFSNAGTDIQGGLAVWGASFQTRLLINLLINAINMLRKHKSEAIFVKTEAEARAWLEERRKVFAQQKK